jgi:hypothetical protein
MTTDTETKIPEEFTDVEMAESNKGPVVKAPKASNIPQVPRKKFFRQRYDDHIAFEIACNTSLFVY